ncbi:hemerythrin domain-containing protein [Streptomyces sp. NBC_01803]|uniref:hemerythrin domain-containing protein n=1 Tax=Streptomyces sp. NBC_01803 TaxID=2975946 RepID=UPI002DDBF9B8|nr:hemerythrin domain-containing protein [Streptomyces sp. NBC_01803]WSA46693.1 hemerythrin domain-containing protein [Streptomyces sp. NBC_01803]
MGHAGDIVRELVADHQEVEDIFQEIERLPTGEKRRKLLADQVTIELVRHSIAEETHLYPAVREHLTDGDRVADREIEDHTAAERIMKELERHDAGDPEFDRLMDKLMSEIRSHMQDEEDNLFPALRICCSEEELERLGDQVRHAKRTAPTRPHPAAPDKPPFNRLLARGTGLVDRARDLLSGRGKR